MPQINELSAFAKKTFLWKNCYIKDPSSGKVLTIANAVDGAYTTLENFTGKDNQLFLLKYWPEKGYTFGSKLDEWKVLCTSRKNYTNDNDYKSPGFQTWVYAWMNGGNQFWNLSQREKNNSFVIRNTHSNLNLRASNNTVIQDYDETRWELFSEGIRLSLKSVKCLLPSRGTSNWILDDIDNEPLGIMLQGARVASGFGFPVLSLLDSAIDIAEFSTDLITKFGSSNRNKDQLYIKADNVKIWPSGEYETIDQGEEKKLNLEIAKSPRNIKIELMEWDRDTWLEKNSHDSLGGATFYLKKLTPKGEYTISVRSVKEDSAYLLTFIVD